MSWLGAQIPANGNAAKEERVSSASSWWICIFSRPNDLKGFVKMYERCSRSEFQIDCPVFLTPIGISSIYSVLLEMATAEEDGSGLRTLSKFFTSTHVKRQ